MYASVVTQHFTQRASSLHSSPDHLNPLFLITRLTSLSPTNVWFLRLFSFFNIKPHSLCQLSVAEADYDRPRAVTSSLSGLRQISENVLSTCCTTGMEPAARKRSGIFSRCNCLSLVSRLTCSAALPDTGKQDTDTDIITADISRPCNGFAMLRRVINWRIYYYYYYYYYVF